MRERLPSVCASMTVGILSTEVLQDTKLGPSLTRWAGREEPLILAFGADAVILPLEKEPRLCVNYL